MRRSRQPFLAARNTAHLEFPVANGRYLVMNAKSERTGPITADSHRQQVPLRKVLRRAGHELVHLAWLLDNLQAHIRPLLQEAAAHDTNMLLQMQSFDHIGQAVQALGDFFTALARETPGPLLVDPAAAARGVSLSDLSSRLGFTSEEKSPCSVPRGEYELF